MVIVTVISALAGQMVWQQWRAVQVEDAERARNQATWILTGAVDWARLILREDARAGGSDHLGEPWAVPLEEARLSTFLAGGREDLEANPALQSFVSGSISDAQSRFNLRNLAVDGPAGASAERALRSLCTSAGIDQTTADLLVQQARRAFVPSKGESQTGGLAPERWTDLRWWGLDTATLERLRPFVTVLPRMTAVNLNTAPAEVIAAVVEGADLGSARRLVQVRAQSPLQKVEAALEVLRVAPEAAAAFPLTTQSSFFEIVGRLRLAERRFNEWVLVERRQLDVVVLARERTGNTQGSLRSAGAPP
jgi:general secretion pathway protein K